jgi:hypothetical protein
MREEAIRAFEKEHPAWLKIQYKGIGNTLIHYAAVKGLYQTVFFLMKIIPGTQELLNKKGETWMDLASANTLEKVKVLCARLVGDQQQRQARRN